MGGFYQQIGYIDSKIYGDKKMLMSRANPNIDIENNPTRIT
jgi:hypothetical protein